MAKITLGILAHVDAGKTTLSERILFEAGALRRMGRVDSGDTALDTDAVERERGITVFSDQAFFRSGGNDYTLVDTPGHIDFAAEAERPMPALDEALLLVDGGSGVRSHTVTLFRMAERYGLPVAVFINKTDLAAYDGEKLMRQMRARLDARMVPVENGVPDYEALAEADDGFLERYLAGDATDDDAWDALKRLYAARRAFPVLRGAALGGTGVKALMEALDRLADALPAHGAPSDPLDAVVYKVRHDKRQTRATYLRLNGGTLRARDAFRFSVDGETVTEKIHEIRRVHGDAYDVLEEASAGDCVAVTGLSVPKPGDRLASSGGVNTIGEGGVRYVTTPTLASRVVSLDGADTLALLGKMRVMEAEDPLLSVEYDTALRQISLRVTGPIQLEVLARVMQTRFGLRVAFEKPRVLYMETIAAPVAGCGHYEPLRHYAEVHLLLEPGARGEGVTFESRCHVDDLPSNYQNLIRTHVFEKTHRGILTGAPLTDVHVALIDGRAHLKHTEGGDFREATYRAIRQGLEQAQNVLLEPYYFFEIAAPSEYAGRVMNDVTALHGAFDPPETIADETRVRGRGPVSTFMEYPKALLSFTKGTGSVQMSFAGYEPCHNAAEVVAGAAYNKDADLANPSSSIFCAHGAGFLVPWYEARAYMHCLR